MLYINENQQIISEVNGVAIPQYPYKCDELHGVAVSYTHLTLPTNVNV